MVFKDEETQAQATAWNYAFAFVNTGVVKCAVHLEIPDILEKHGGSISLSDLSLAVGCPSPSIYRIMRFLTYRGFFAKTTPEESVIHYMQTPVSRLFTRANMAPFVQMHTGPFGGINAEALRTGKRPDLKIENGDESEWNSDFLDCTRLFTDAMEYAAKVLTSAMIANYPEGFEGVGSLVDVGGRYGMAISMLVNAFPWIRGTNFDLPQVVADAPAHEGVVHVGGSMFECIPKADAVIIMRVLHDWSDEACITTLKKCREAIPADTGKVMIVDAIVEEEGDRDEFASARLESDMVMMAITVAGKERTYKEWVDILDAAGFSNHNVKHIGALESVIEAYP